MIDYETKLFEDAKRGDSTAIDELLGINKHLVATISRKYFLMGGDSEDVIQEGMIGLFKAITTYDSSKGTTFVGYAGRLIEREIISAIRHENSLRQHILHESVLLDTEEDFAEGESPEDDYIDEESITELTHEINDKLSNFEREVVEYYLKGYNYIDIAKILNKPSKAIDNALTRIKNKLSYLKERL